MRHIVAIITAAFSITKVGPNAAGEESMKKL